MKSNFIIFLIIILLNNCSIFAQGAEMQTLKVGQRMPDISLGKLVDSDGRSIKASDFEGKLLILDFWATWCSPCVSFLSVADSLQEEFQGKIVILPVTYEKQSTVNSFLKRREKFSKSFSITSLVEDTVLRKFFPHNLIPHEVWIDGKGIIRAITESDQVTRLNINSMLQRPDFRLPVKLDKTKRVRFGEPTFTLTQDRSVDELKYTSILTGFNQEFAPGLGASSNYLTMANVSIPYLYRWALGKGNVAFIPNNRTIYEVEDTSRLLYTHNLKKDPEWVRKNWYCYEFNAGDSVFAESKFDFAVAELNNYFRNEGINGRLEQRAVQCWVLTSLSSLNRIKTKGSESKYEVDLYHYILFNGKISTFINDLQTKYQQFSPLPFVDQSGIMSNVDLVLECSPAASIEKINKELEKYDLRFVKKTVMLDMVVISQRSIR